jgi:hypothetical protein
MLSLLWKLHWMMINHRIRPRLSKETPIDGVEHADALPDTDSPLEQLLAGWVVTSIKQFQSAQSSYDDVTSILQRGNFSLSSTLKVAINLSSSPGHTPTV